MLHSQRSCAQVVQLAWAVTTWYRHGLVSSTRCSHGLLATSRRLHDQCSAPCVVLTSYPPAATRLMARSARAGRHRHTGPARVSRRGFPRCPFLSALLEYAATLPRARPIQWAYYAHAVLARAACVRQSAACAPLRRRQVSMITDALFRCSRLARPPRARAHAPSASPRRAPTRRAHPTLADKRCAVCSQLGHIQRTCSHHVCTVRVPLAPLSPA